MLSGYYCTYRTDGWTVLGTPFFSKVDLEKGVVKVVLNNKRPLAASKILQYRKRLFAYALRISSPKRRLRVHRMSFGSV